MTLKEDVIGLINEYYFIIADTIFICKAPNERFYEDVKRAKQCAFLTIEREYHSLREMLFSLRVSKVIESEKVYLSRLDELNELEKEIKQEIENYMNDLFIKKQENDTGEESLSIIFQTERAQTIAKDTGLTPFKKMIVPYTDENLNYIMQWIKKNNLTVTYDFIR